MTASDALEIRGMRLAELGRATRDAMRQILPREASLQNPVDMLASASPEQYAACLRTLLIDPCVDGVLVILPPPPRYTAGAVAKALIPVVHAADKPVVVALMGERLIQEAVEHFRAAHIPEYRFPERAASALAALAARAEYLQRIQAQQTAGELPAPPVDSARTSAVFAQWPEPLSPTTPVEPVILLCSCWSLMVSQPCRWA